MSFGACFVRLHQYENDIMFSLLLLAGHWLGSAKALPLNSPLLPEYDYIGTLDLHEEQSC